MMIHEKIKTFREEQLNISQQEAAKLLDIQPGNLSRYESGSRQLSLDTLLLMYERYGMTKEQFFDILSLSPGTRKTAETLVEQARESKDQYYSQFHDLLDELLKDAAFRELLIELRDRSTKERTAFLQAILKNHS